MQTWMDVVVLGNPLIDWLTAIGIATAINLSVILVKRLAINHLAERARRSATRIDDALLTALQGTRPVLVFLVSLLIGCRYLALTERVDAVIAGAATLATFVQVGLWLSAAVRTWLQHSRDRALATDAGAATSLAAMGFIAQALLWTLVVLLALDNLGVNITALVAGLGIGGVAIALAVQNILGDLFASLSIVIDKPFVIGDFIIVDGYMGTVEYVGLKTTHVRSLGGEQIIFPNGDLLKARTRNYKRMRERRVVFSFGLDYATDPAQIPWVTGLVKDLITAQEGVRFDRAHFQKFGGSSLDFEVVYWLLDPDFNRSMDVQQAINIALLQALGKAGIEFAFPTQVTYVRGSADISQPVASKAPNKAATKDTPAQLAGRRSADGRAA